MAKTPIKTKGKTKAKSSPKPVKRFVSDETRENMRLAAHRRWGTSPD
jgi:hypothetical protein